MTADHIFRRADYALSDEQRALREAYATFFEKECSVDRVREGEPFGFDEPLWRRLVELRAIGLGVPADCGGEGAQLVDLVLVAEQLGRSLAPVPLIESIVAARLLARCGPAAAGWLAAVIEGDRIVTLALDRSYPGRAQLIPAGAIADGVVGLVEEHLVVATSVERPVPVANHACAPLASWDLAATGIVADVIADGREAAARFEQLRSEWKLLMAAALVGLADGALELAVEFARDRMAFGVPIATFQAVSHPLADGAIDIVGGRRLVWKAAWFADHEPTEAPQLIPMAYLHAARTAVMATTVGVHTQGGLGFTNESPMQLFFRRAKGWANVSGDPAAERRRIADVLYGPARV